jgi:uncharacterized damage-inducible protein DinB
MQKLTLLVALLLVAVCAFAADDREMTAKHWKTTGEFTIAVADAMPADAWTFKPNPAEMSFGALMAHFVAYNNGAVAAVTGSTAPKTPEKTEDKAAMMEFTKASAAFWDTALAGVTPEQLDKMSGREGRQTSGRERLWGAFTHTAHHRGQAEVYLRVKGITPPPYRF